MVKEVSVAVEPASVVVAVDNGFMTVEVKLVV